MIGFIAAWVAIKLAKEEERKPYISDFAYRSKEENVSGWLILALLIFAILLILLLIYGIDICKFLFE